MKQNTGVLYVMTTDIPGLIHIGATRRERFEDQVKRWSKSGHFGVGGLRFRYGIEVRDYIMKGQLLELVFNHARVNVSGLYAVDIDVAERLLKVLDGMPVAYKDETITPIKQTIPPKPRCRDRAAIEAANTILDAKMGTQPVVIKQLVDGKVVPIPEDKRYSKGFESNQVDPKEAVEDSPQASTSDLESAPDYSEHRPNWEFIPNDALPSSLLETLRLAKDSRIPEQVYEMTSNVTDFGEAKGWMQYQDGMYIVLPGSTVSPVRKSYRGVVRSVPEEAKVDENHLLLNPIPFDNPSGAASLITGTAVSGWITWRDENGEKLKAIRNRSKK